MHISYARSPVTHSNWTAEPVAQLDASIEPAENDTEGTDTHSEKLKTHRLPLPHSRKLGLRSAVPESKPSNEHKHNDKLHRYSRQLLDGEADTAVSVTRSLVTGWRRLTYHDPATESHRVIVARYGADGAACCLYRQRDDVGRDKDDLEHLRRGPGLSWRENIDHLAE